MALLKSAFFTTAVCFLVLAGLVPLLFTGLSAVQGARLAVLVGINLVLVGLLLHQLWSAAMYRWATQHELWCLFNLVMALLLEVALGRDLSGPLIGLQHDSLLILIVLPVGTLGVYAGLSRLYATA